MARQVNQFHTAMRNEAKQLRKDARRLDTIAKHLRDRASEILKGIKADERAEAARTNFYSKPAKIDPSLPLTPEIPADDPLFKAADHA